QMSNVKLTASVFGGGVALLLLSLSRSYWLALVTLVATGAVCSLWSWRQSHHSPIRTNRRMVHRVLLGGGAIGIALLLAAGVVRLPYPKPLTAAGIGSTLLARLSADAAVSNRWQQLGPLWETMRTHLVFGNGFGAAVTYTSKDPRTLAAFPDGRYTTTAFEWGYLDDLLERGIIGLLVELWLLAVLMWHGIRAFLFTLPFSLITCSLSLALLALAIVHATSPYLNHPLGIGLLLLVFAGIAHASPRDDSRLA
ncbi:O-antigen ligase family protein, partial [Candidatus Uhrbacteria bacterium]|nr:O-antigen ligase family protein [Candidatus Uhrbacteria bacterium]